MIDLTYWLYQLPAMIIIITAGVLIGWRISKAIKIWRKKKDLRRRYKQFMGLVEHAERKNSIEVYHCKKCNCKVYTTMSRCSHCGEEFK